MVLDDPWVDILGDDLRNTGEGVKVQDAVEAYKWFSLCASGETDSKRRAGAESMRDEAGALMTQAQIAEAQRLARYWVRK